MKRCSSVNPDRVVLPRLHERLQTIGNAPVNMCINNYHVERVDLNCFKGSAAYTIL
uniref:Uncharacterized protein n=1 Tax=Kuenenia stuttgartiensis TaxID=174633 RepID=Q1PWS0_KUEST|nr:unknown protein [Candidatus Kuenenia stuttgartiensis]